MSASDPLDLDRVMTEIREEVRARRAAGDFPPSLERDLDLVFDRFVPKEPLDSDFTEAIQAADRAAYINVAVPTDSQKAGVGEVKRVLRKAMGWYLDYLAQQMTAFGTASIRALRALGERQAVLEEQVAQWRPREDDGRDRSTEALDVSAWAGMAVAHMKDAPGRVMHAECGTGQLVRLLTDAGVDAYGVDPRGPLVDRAVADGLDAFPDDPFIHIDAVAAAGLGGIVLSGWPDRATLGRKWAMVEKLAEKLAPAGRIVLVAADPGQWARRVPPLEADLAPGRPLHATTWAHLLERSGFEKVEVSEGALEESLGRVSGDAPGADALNHAIGEVERLLFGPAYGVVTAARPR